MQNKDEAIPHYRQTMSFLTVDGQCYTTYGIAGKNLYLEDISTDPELVNGIVQKINDAELQECHLLEVIEDFLI